MPAAIIDRLKGIMRSEKGIKLIVSLGLAGLLCILFSGFIDTDEHKDERTSAQNSTSIHQLECDEYAEELEERLADMLMKTEGVGKCRVMITVSGSLAFSYAQDSEQYADVESHEIKQEHVILKEDTGDEPLVEYTENPEVVGVIIACEGGGNNVVREQVYRAAGAVLDISLDRICVTKLIDESEEQT